MALACTLKHSILTANNVAVDSSSSMPVQQWQQQLIAAAQQRTWEGCL
jgi:hypothetical protein